MQLSGSQCNTERNVINIDEDFNVSDIFFLSNITSDPLLHNSGQNTSSEAFDLDDNTVEVFIDDEDQPAPIEATEAPEAQEANEALNSISNEDTQHKTTANNLIYHNYLPQIFLPQFHYFPRFPINPVSYIHPHLLSSQHFNPHYNYRVTPFVTYPTHQTYLRH